MSRSLNLHRDQNSQAVINTDLAALNKYKSERTLYRKVEMLSHELVEIKECMTRLNERLEKIESN